MAYNALNNLIDAYIYANGVQAITGQILNGVLKQMVSQLGSGYHLMGVAGPETVPASNDYAMAYFAATAGEYTDFGGITLAAGEVAVLLTSGNGSWSKQTIYNVPTTTEDLENTANFITNAVTDLVNYYTKTEVDDTLANYPTLEALATALADYYTKTEIDTILAGYTTNTALASALADYYNKNDIDGLLSVVNAALADRYTKSETDTKLADYYRKAETYDKDEVDSIVAALSRQEYIVAWDGLAAPDVSAIPAGVTVTYSGTTYTGTLAASASTVNKIYMVWNGTAYDMYGTSQDGGYSWVPMGTTTVDLSQYATKSEVSQLEAKVDDLTRENYDADFSIADENGMAIVQFKNGHINTKNFDSKELSEMVKNSDKDFTIGDGNYDIVQFSGGHIKTKNFDSKNLDTKVDDSISDFAITDENNNDIVRFKHGHIQTKFFNSENATGGVSTPLSGKVLCTSGDSITRGHGVNPEKFLPTNDPYYPAAGSEPDSNAPTYGYLIAKDNKMKKWYNMGISGSTLGDVFAMGVDHNGFSKQNGRYTQLPSDIDFLTLWFGWNDRAYGATMAKEIYLQAEYGTYIKYPDGHPELIGQPGWATQSQVDEINAIGDWNYWLSVYTGTINDSTNKTYCGAMNIVLKYLLQERPMLKILIICGWDYYIEESKEIAKKYGVGFINIREAGNVVSWAATDGIDNSVLFTFDPSIYTTHPEYYRKPEYIPLAGNYTQSEYKRNLLTSDGTHPNEKGYEFIYPRINDKLLKL